MSPAQQPEEVAMTQPNPGDGGNAAPTNQNPQQAPATGPAAAPQFIQPIEPAAAPGPSSADTTAEDQQAQQLLAAAMQQDGGDSDQLGDAGKRALDAERAARKAAEDAAKATQKQVADLTQQLEALKPAADIFAQLRKAAVPDEEKTDAEKLREELDQLRQTAESERVERFRAEVAAAKKLTPEQAARLQGKTREELIADADALLALFPQAPVPAPSEAEPTAVANGQPQAGQQPAPAANGPRPDPSQGARGPLDLNQAIEDALAKGDVRTSIALKQQLRAQQQTQ